MVMESANEGDKQPPNATGRAAESASREKGESGLTPAVVTEDLTRRFERVTAVSHLSLTVKRGAFFGLLGSSRRPRGTRAPRGDIASSSLGRLPTSSRREAVSHR